MEIRDFILLISPTVVAIGIAVSTYYIREQLRLNREQMQMNYCLTKREKALEFSITLNSHIRNAVAKIENCFGPLLSLTEALSTSQIKEKVKEDRELMEAITTILGHWEIMALSINSCVSDKDVCRDMVASTVIQHVRIFHNFIAARRAINKRIYVNLLMLCMDWQAELGETNIPVYAPIFSGYTRKNGQNQAEKSIQG